MAGLRRQTVAQSGVEDVYVEDVMINKACHRDERRAEGDGCLVATAYGHVVNTF